MSNKREVVGYMWPQNIMEHYILNDVCVYLLTWEEVHNILDGKTTFKQLSVALLLLLSG